MEESLQKLQQHLDGMSKAEKYQLAIDKLTPQLAALSPWIEMIEIDDEDNEDDDEEALIKKHTRIIKNGPKEIAKWLEKGTGIKKIREVWEVSAALFDVTFENYHQGGANACGIAEALCWLAACAIYDETKQADFHYEKFDGLDYPEPPHLVRVLYHIALAKNGIAALAPGQIGELAPETLQSISKQLTDFTRQ